MIDCIKRINNIGFKKSTYLCAEPKTPGYDILYIEKNPLYGKDKTGEYVPDNFGMYVKNDDEIKYGTRYDESCFKNDESCFVIASFEYDEHEPCWELKTIGKRICGLENHEIDDFWKIMRFGFDWLKEKDYKNG